MLRQPVLDLLRAHLGRELDAHEVAMTATTIQFVAVHADCLLRSCEPGHLTGSAWIVSPDCRKVLLTHHLKLDQWLPLGGPADGDGDWPAVAMREAPEESGLVPIRAVGAAIFDLDRHWIPPGRTDPGHPASSKVGLPSGGSTGPGVTRAAYFQIGTISSFRTQPV